jgi:hypothetical protein
LNFSSKAIKKPTQGRVKNHSIRYGVDINCRDVCTCLASFSLPFVASKICSTGGNSVSFSAPITQFSLNRFGNRHPLGLRKILSNFVFGVFANQYRINVNNACRDSVDTQVLKCFNTAT